MTRNSPAYRLIALDLDGTLLNSRHQIPERARSALARLAGNGVHVILVSARTPRSVAGFARAIGLNTPYVALNGALLVAPDAGLLYRASMSADDAVAVLKVSRRHALVANFYSGFNWYVESSDDTIVNETRILGFGPTVGRLSRTVLRQVDKVLVMGHAQAVSGLHDELVGHGLSAKLSFSKPEYLEISPAGVTKATGLSQVCRHLQVPVSSAIAVGDNFNDLEMLQAAGLGVAMGNAPEVVKQAARLVIGSNDEDGIAEFVERALLAP